MEDDPANRFYEEFANDHDIETFEEWELERERVNEVMPALEALRARCHGLKSRLRHMWDTLIFMNAQDEELRQVFAEQANLFSARHDLELNWVYSRFYVATDRHDVEVRIAYHTQEERCLSILVALCERKVKGAVQEQISWQTLRDVPATPLTQDKCAKLYLFFLYRYRDPLFGSITEAQYNEARFYLQGLVNGVQVSFERWFRRYTICHDVLEAFTNRQLDGMPGFFGQETLEQMYPFG